MKKYYGVYSNRGLGQYIIEYGRVKMPLIFISKKAAEAVAEDRTLTHKRKHVVKAITIK